jgi:hypothetical protein
VDVEIDSVDDNGGVYVDGTGAVTAILRDVIPPAVNVAVVVASFPLI